MLSDDLLDDLMSDSLYIRPLVNRIETITETLKTDEERWFHAFLERYWLLTMTERYRLFCFSYFYMREEE